ncbi:glycosyltransferase [uncultured Agrococcus sp.]|uniref:glycosyltransferase n=1 Tax=uncultured Agrococcus sp. TaxID=382258 RepID=UPI0025FE5C77|nr:glycosyltransferase [uncultured Agrococcus sp.]
MTTALRVILDDVGGQTRTPLAWYGEEITRALIQTAPDEIGVSAFTAAISAEREARIHELFPGLQDLEHARLPAREMREAWLHSFTTFPLSGLVHSTSLFAPLRARIDQDSGQMVVTVHSASAVSDRSTAKDRWFEKAIKRAWKHADGIVVPTYAVANELGEMFDFRGRIRVIAGGVADSLVLPDNANERAKLMTLPERFAVVMTQQSAQSTGEDLVKLLADSAMPDIPIVVVGPVAWDDETLSAMAVKAGIPPARYWPVGELDDADLAVVLSRASALVHISRNDAFALPVLAAFKLECPVVHIATPSLDEVSNGAAISVSPSPDGDLSRPIAEGLRRVLEENGLAAELTALGSDRVRLYDWRMAAEQVWQFHADL